MMAASLTPDSMRKPVKGNKVKGRIPDIVIPSLLCTARKERDSRQWWHMPLNPALRRQSQVDLCEFKASLVYKS